MPTFVEKGVHFLLIAYSTELHLLICNLKLHDTLPVTLPLPESANVDIACLSIHHLALTIRLVSFPLACVSVAVRKVHRPSAGHGASDEIPRVRVARHSDQDTMAMRAAVFLFV